MEAQSLSRQKDPGPGAVTTAEAVHDASPALTHAERSAGRIWRRDARHRRSLAIADASAAALAFILAVVVLGNDQLLLTSLLVIPLTVAAAKLSGLYDRDLLLIHKTTAEEVPAIFQLATATTLVTWLGEGALVSGDLSHREIASLWLLLVGLTV